MAIKDLPDDRESMVDPFDVAEDHDLAADIMLHEALHAEGQSSDGANLVDDVAVEDDRV